MTVGMNKKVILVDDNEDHLDLLSLSLSSDRARDYIGSLTVHTYREAVEAIANLPAEGPVVIITDYSMPGNSGLDWLPDFLKSNVGPVILLTSAGDEHVAAEAFRAGASDYLIKSDVLESPELLYESIQESLRKYKLEQRYDELSRRLKLANKELERKNQRLSELTDSAHRFVDNVAHEYRTPLTVIHEFASIMYDGIGGELSDQQEEYLQYIMNATQDLSQMVDDFLDSSKLKTRTLRVDRMGHSVDSIINSIRPVIRARSERKQIHITEEIVPGLPDVFCDLEKVGRVIINLMVNAIKFSGEGDTIHLWARPLGDDGVEIGLTDYGIGMTEEEVELVCERFRQVGDPQRTSEKGFGLGLNIAKELIWINLGDFNIESKQGEGSTFAFTLPIDDKATILDRYARQLCEHDAGVQLGVLRMSHSDSEIDLETMRGFMTSQCQSMDLVLVDEESRSLLLFGQTDDTEAWAERLKESWGKAEMSKDVKGSLTIRNLGMWDHASLRNFALSRLFNHMEGRLNAG